MERIEAEIERMVAARGPGKTICPSEVARALATDGQDFRPLMPHVREAAAQLAGRGLVEVTQRGQVVDDARTAPGPIRLGMPGGSC